MIRRDTAKVPPIDQASGDLDPPWSARDLEPMEEEIEVEVDLEAFVQAQEPSPTPERVRFVAPMQLRPEGSEDELVGTLLNLSTNGVAIMAPSELQVGRRVWSRFRLNLADEAITVLCEVIWHRPSRVGQQPLYGLRFAGLTREESEQVRAAVRERVEGRAGEWPLPVMPEAPATLEHRQPSAWLSAAAGMVAGIALALLLSVVPSAGVGQPIHPTTSAAKAALSRVAPVLDFADFHPTTSPVTDDADAEESEAEEKVESAQATVANYTPVAEAPSLPVVNAVDPYAFNVEGGPNRAKFALWTDGLVSEHVEFWLENPRRLVVDVMNRRSTFAGSQFDANHPLVKRLRVGQHGSNVRFVIETSEEVASDVATSTHDHALVIELRR